MNCIIVDDEPLARRGIESYIAAIPYLHLIASCSNTLQLTEKLKTEQVDLIFLDIQMPKMTGIDFLKNTQSAPITIITTAYPDYALISYELDVVDYLVKPISFERFERAVEKASDFFASKQKPAMPAGSGDDFFFIKCVNKYEKLFYDDIIFFEAKQNYVAVHTVKKKLISYLTMKNVEEYLPPSKFVKINKSCIVSLAKIESITGNVITSGIYSFTIGRTNREQILSRILGDNILKRK